MSLIKYIAIAALILFGLILALIGILSVTHDTPVTSVIAEGDKGWPAEHRRPLSSLDSTRSDRSWATELSRKDICNSSIDLACVVALHLAVEAVVNKI